MQEKKPNLVVLMETKLRKSKMEMIRTKIGFKNLFVVKSVGKSEGLGLFWEDDCEVESKISAVDINAVINNRDMDMDWKFTSFYGHPDATKRFEAWNLLKSLEQLTLGPWVCIGDFNEIVTLSDGREYATLESNGSISKNS